MESFLHFFCLLTAVAFEKVGSLTHIEIRDQFAENSARKASFQPIEEHRDKLLNILLNEYIDGFSKRFVRDTKISRGKIDSIRRF